MVAETWWVVENIKVLTDIGRALLFSAGMGPQNTFALCYVFKTYEEAEAYRDENCPDAGITSVTRGG